MIRALTELQKHGLAQQAIGDDVPLENPAEGNPISHGQIIGISEKLKQIREEEQHDAIDDAASHHLDGLLRGSKIYVQPPRPKVEPVAMPSPALQNPTNLNQTSEYKALMARLHREEEDRTYERMINPPLPAEIFSQRFPNSSQATLFPASQADVGEDDEISYTDINRQMALIINILISIVACSVAIWLVARHLSTPSRLGLSMGGSGMIGVAEVVIYAGYLRRLKEAREKGKEEVEVKEIIKTWVIGRDEDSTSNQPKIIESKQPHDEKIRRRKPTPR